ncbi:hypothetical protein BQ8794_110148 [Mesorhizobium prunaredense]|uniref:Transposase IS801/IS1294 domain-containing protein n=1 Tax=Mesorhizobium prunaredense TaxID=1631249 RepID=A0A1R3V0D4_9HYPH|nr:hypothetical protein BQ8794_110148 [Mesorhizobium prunaredense]
MAYLSRYTHRVAISNSRLISANAETVTFRWKDYRIRNDDRHKVMRLATDEFIRRFLIHVLPDGFHRIRHYGLLAAAGRKANVAKIRKLLGEKAPSQDETPSGITSVCASLCRTRQNRRDTTADGLKTQPSSHHR